MSRIIPDSLHQQVVEALYENTSYDHDGNPLTEQDRRNDAALTALGAAPVAQPECLHDETHRLGAIWTECTQCNRMWADDDSKNPVAQQVAPAPNLLTDAEWQGFVNGSPFLRCGCGATMPCAEHYARFEVAPAPAPPVAWIRTPSLAEIRAGRGVAPAPAQPEPLTDDDLNELAYSAHGEAVSFGLSHETFLRYFKTIRARSVGVAPAPAQQARELTGEQEAFCAGHCCWSGHHKDCPRHDPPAAAPEPTKLDRFLSMVRVWVERDGGDMDAALAWMHASPVGVEPTDAPSLLDLDKLARVHASFYASPHHFTIGVESLRNLIRDLSPTGGNPK